MSQQPEKRTLAPFERAKRAVREAPMGTTMEELEKRVSREIVRGSWDRAYTELREQLLAYHEMLSRHDKERREFLDGLRSRVNDHEPDDEGDA